MSSSYFFINPTGFRILMLGRLAWPRYPQFSNQYSICNQYVLIRGQMQVEKLTQLVWLKCLYIWLSSAKWIQMGKLQNELQSSTRTRTYPNPKCIVFFWEAILKNQQKPVKIILSFQVTHVTPQRNYAKFSQCKTSHPRYQISFLLSEHNTLGRGWPVSGLIMLRSTDS